MGRMNKSERKEYAKTRAYELARSGRFLNWLAIEQEIRLEELVLEARDVLDDERIRDELDKLCDEAMRSHDNA